MLAMWVWWIAAVVLIAAIVFALARPSKRPETTLGVTAEELLKKRYAKGEIEQQDYEERLQELRK